MSDNRNNTLAGSLEIRPHGSQVPPPSALAHLGPIFNASASTDHDTEEAAMPAGSVSFRATRSATNPQTATTTSPPDFSKRDPPNWFATATPTSLFGFPPVPQQLALNAAEATRIVSDHANADALPGGTTPLFDEANRPLLPGENIFAAVDPRRDWCRFENLLGGFVPNPGADAQARVTWNRLPAYHVGGPPVRDDGVAGPPHRRRRGRKGPPRARARGSRDAVGFEDTHLFYPEGSGSSKHDGGA